jgi:hypothetical protein
MTKGRGNAAESLSELVELIYSRRHTGLLSIERFGAGSFETGEMYFQQGQPIFARVGNMVGQDAFRWLLHWQHIYFSFQTDVAPPIANFFSAADLPYLPMEDSPVGRQESPRDGLKMPDVEWLIPQRLMKDKSVLSLPLTRLQRSVYLLVDGRRTVSDLARCIRKSVPEISRLLSELRERGLVSL